MLGRFLIGSLPIAMVLMTRLSENFCRSSSIMTPRIGRVRRWAMQLKGGGNGGGGGWKFSFLYKSFTIENRKKIQIRRIIALSRHGTGLEQKKKLNFINTESSQP
ncbi:hypothetical protein AVEN_27471-1 [Araneus ventricosus]|uniref:Secreted protein n=1 Tax=Araneus ventricosus TaxID=182803 RepID=A0A4Y2N772_ARAVE|nr:hypothetical protein AVEN_2241-1 [Araneus ventricosus]GBO30390.1 hypothetical protein AVEN_27471-1 [Araneus ventricosus]